MSSSQAHSGRGERRYLRPPVPLFFPSDEEVPELKLHLLLRTALFQLIRLALGHRVIVGSDQFVYFDAANPNRRLAPDVLVWVGAPDQLFDNWKVWERGAPHIAVEIVSPSDKPPGPWGAKLERYKQCGVKELVRFDPESKTAPLRLWDRIDGDLVERDLSAPDGLHCDALGLWWCVQANAQLGPMLRLARDAAGLQLLPTLEESQAEQAQAAAEQAQVAAEQAQVAAEQAQVAAEQAQVAAREAEARNAAEARVKELEQELAQLRGATGR
jgi:hypothetical protein